MANTNRRNANVDVDQENLDLTEKLLKRLEDVNGQISKGNKLLGKFNSGLDLTTGYQDKISNNQQRYNEALLSNKSIQDDVNNYNKDILDQKVKLNKLQREGASVDILQQEEDFLKLLEEQAKSTFDLYNTNKQAIDQSKRAVELSGDNLTTLQEIAKNKENIGKEDFKNLDYTKQIQEFEEEIVIAIKDGNTLLATSLQERQKVLQAAQAESEAQDKINTKISAARDKIVEFGDSLLNLVPGGKDGFLGKMLGLDTISKNLKDNVGGAMADAFKNAGGGAKGFFSAASAGASTLMASLLPILPILLAIAGVVALVKLFMDADKQVSELAHNLNVSYKEAGKLQNAAVDIAASMDLVGMNAADVTKQMGDLQTATGMNIGKMALTNEKAKGLLETSTMLTTQFGLTADETIGLNSAAAITGTTLENISLQAQALGEDGLVPAQEIMKEIAKTSKSTLMNFSKNPKALALAVKQAKLMGVTLDQVAIAGDKLMEIESSVTAENKARLILGRDINMNAARYYAMTGQTEKQMAEMKKQAGTLANYEKMGPIQRRALADALGMSNDELAGMMAKEKELQSMGIDEKKLNEILAKDKDGQLDLQSTLNGLKDDEARKMLKAKLAEQQRAGIQEKLGSTIQKVTDLLYKMVAPLLPMIDSFVASLGDGQGALKGLSDTFSGIGKFISNVLWPVLKILFAPMAKTIAIVKTVIEKIGEAMNGIFGPVKDGEKSFNVLAVVADGLIKVFSGIGVVIADFIMRPFMLVTGILGGVIKIFKGDFVEGIKQVGGAILSFLLFPFEAVGDFIDEVFGTNLVDSVKEVFSKIGDAIIDTLGGAWDVIAGIFTLDGDRILDGIKSIGKGLYNALVQPFMDAWDFIGNLFGIGNLGSSIIDGFKSVFGEIGDMMMEYIGGAWDVVSGIFTLDGDKILEGLKSIGGAITDLLIYPFKKAYELILSFFGGGSNSGLGSRIVDGILSIGSMVLDALTWPFKMSMDFIGNLFGMGNLGSSIIDSMKNIFGDVGNIIVKYLGGAWDVISGIFTLDGDKILSGLKSIGNSIIDLLTYPFEKAWDFIGNLFGMGDLGSSIIDGFKSVFGEIGDMIMEYVGGAWDVVSGIFTLDGDKILEGLKSIGNSIISMLTYPFEKAMNLIGKLFGVKELGSSIIKSIKSFGKKVIENIKAPFVKAIDWISETFGGIGGKLIDGISNIASSIWNFITTPFKKAWEWITGLFSGTGKKIIDGISNLATDVWSTVTGAFESGYDWVVDKFSGVGGKIVDGISSVGGAITDAITAPFTQAWDNISGWLGFSPSELGNGIVKGISSVGSNIESSLTKPFENAEQQITATFEGIGTVIEKISGGIAMIIDTIGSNISKIITSITESIATLGQVDAGNLAKVGLALSALGVGLIALTAGEVVNGIASFFGASPVDTLKELETIDGNKMKVTGDGLTAMADSLKNFGGIDTAPISAAADALDKFNNQVLKGGLADALNSFLGSDPFAVFTQLAAIDTGKIDTVAKSIALAGTSIESFNQKMASLDDSVADKGDIITALLNDIADVEYSEIDSLASAIDNLSKSYDSLLASMKNITDDDISRMQQIASATPKDVGGGGIGDTLSSAMSGVKDLASNAISSVGSFFGFGEDDPVQETQSTTVATTPITPVMQPVASVNTQPIVQTNQTINTDNTQPNFKNVEALLKELISKVDQPVVLKIGEKAISEMQSVMSLKKSYSSNVNGYRA